MLSSIHTDYGFDDHFLHLPGFPEELNYLINRYKFHQENREAMQAVRASLNYKTWVLVMDTIDTIYYERYKDTYYYFPQDGLIDIRGDYVNDFDFYFDENLQEYNLWNYIDYRTSQNIRGFTNEQDIIRELDRGIIVCDHLYSYLEPATIAKLNIQRSSQYHKEHPPITYSSYYGSMQPVPAPGPEGDNFYDFF